MVMAALLYTSFFAGQDVGILFANNLNNVTFFKKDGGKRRKKGCEA
jgi:hypothetical protein